MPGISGKSMAGSDAAVVKVSAVGAACGVGSAGRRASLTTAFSFFRSMGLLKCALMPAALAFSISSGKALAVSAMMGTWGSMAWIWRAAS